MTEIIIDGMRLTIEKEKKPMPPKRDRAWLVLCVGLPIIAAIFIYLNSI
jgi:hypothetical protein